MSVSRFLTRLDHILVRGGISEGWLKELNRERDLAQVAKAIEMIWNDAFFATPGTPIEQIENGRKLAVALFDLTSRNVAVSLKEEADGLFDCNWTVCRQLANNLLGIATSKNPLDKKLLNLVFRLGTPGIPTKVTLLGFLLNKDDISLRLQALLLIPFVVPRGPDEVIKKLLDRAFFTASDFLVSEEKEISDVGFRYLQWNISRDGGEVDRDKTGVLAAAVLQSEDVIMQLKGLQLLLHCGLLEEEQRDRVEELSFSGDREVSHLAIQILNLGEAEGDEEPGEIEDPLGSEHAYSEESGGDEEKSNEDGLL